MAYKLMGNNTKQKASPTQGGFLCFCAYELF